MNNFSKILSAATLFTLIFSTTIQADAYRLPKLKNVGAFKMPVISQTAPETVKKNEKSALIRRRYIAKWGVHRYELGYVVYKCSETKCSVFQEPKATHFFEKCVGFTTAGKAICSGLVSSQDSTDSGSGSSYKPENPWYACDDLNNDCNSSDELDEFPGRGNGEGGPDDRGSDQGL